VNRKVRIALQIFGVGLIAALFFFFWQGRKASDSASARQGEEVYASHDCSDCHLGAHILKQKRDKKELGLIRVRKDIPTLVRFLETDARHRSFTMISAEDRENLTAYLRTLVPAE
jgi:mono/diheme cytochrome c family protein